FAPVRWSCIGAHALPSEPQRRSTMKLHQTPDPTRPAPPPDSPPEPPPGTDPPVPLPPDMPRPDMPPREPGYDTPIVK
ncbi:hypothetical protein, partial [Burkholderia sp. LMG 13014]